MGDQSLTISLMKLLCLHGGRLEKNQLADLLDLSAKEVEQILQDESLIFPQSFELVLAQSPLRTCDTYLYSDEGCKEECPKLHLCTHYLKDQCFTKKGHRCKFSHDVFSDHNNAVLEVNELSELNEDEIKVLLFQNDNMLLPQDCTKYVRDTCDQGEDCKRLHMCRYFTRGSCYSQICEKSHNLLDSKIMLKCRWMSQKTIENFQMLCDLKHNERHRIPRGVANNKEAREARLKTRDIGGRRPRKRDDSQDSVGRSRERKKEEGAESIPPPDCKASWELVDRENTRNLPHLYLEVLQAGSYISVDFQTMKAGDKQVRRLSTPSSVSQPAEYVLTTKWIWYWKDEFGTWTKYGYPNTKNVRASICSSDLETIYFYNPGGTIPFTAEKQNYIVNCQEMRQRNLNFKTEKEVRRRPKFQDFKKVKMLKGSIKAAAGSSNQKPSNPLLRTSNYPAQWDMNALPDIGYKKVLVDNTCAEFSNIVKMFSKTVSGQTVKKLWRIQNPTLWQVYQWQKDQMKKKNSGIAVDERQLFHATESANVDAICNDNFDWRICGTNGVQYGQGSYFARDASYSHNYAPPTSEGTRTMFVARVLVGDFVLGVSTMRRPPQKSKGPKCYDSCVNNVRNPSVFVVFEKFQIYPEYILEYGEEGTSGTSSCIIL
ncbi:PREDICTED: poly [ADP-ribose] polymerase 12-like [Nanorana parkeri]|uniref:poly [ADP-ribose] polymerase 12-like n=1 Tax=Nanorana parkeri TaxID=125878 RepID=UPI000854A0A1|nr:PREDICTED: poly [ADP-ribose] polymerase 12-like [Nanorana parkeri]